MPALNRQFVPAWTRTQFLAWAKKRYPETSFSKWSKRRLIALFCNTK